MSKWGKLSSAVRHVAKHKTRASFAVDTEVALESASVYESAVNEFSSYVECLKTLSAHVEELKKQFLETFGKAGRIGQCLVELTEQKSGGPTALQANRIRSVIARIQASIVRKLIPDLDNVLLSDLLMQTSLCRDIKTRITKRMDLVADANHYSAKYNSLLASGGDQQSDKFLRNKEKCESAQRKLKEETDSILDEIAKIERIRQAMCSERCDWFRSLLHVFFVEGVKAHLSSFESIGNHILSIESSTTDSNNSLSKVSATSKNVRSMGTLVNTNLQHAVKHKGNGLLLGSGGSGGGIKREESSIMEDSGEFGVMSARFKHTAKVMNSLKLGLENYLQSIQLLLNAIGFVVTDFGTLVLKSSSTSSPHLLEQSWLKCHKIFQDQLIHSLTAETVDTLEMQLNAISQVESVKADRKAHQLDVSYYAAKLKGMKDKVEKSSTPMDAAFIEKQTRNLKKYEFAVSEFELTTTSALALFRSFEMTGNELVSAIMETYLHL